MTTKYTEDILREAVSNSASIAGVLRYLGRPQAGGNHSHISNRIKKYAIDTSHFTGQAWNIGKRYAPKKTAVDILIILSEGSARPKRKDLYRALIEIGREYVCSECSKPPIWNNKPLTLEIDHIDGNWLNNLEDNLRFLCPDCHSQQSTNKPYKYRADVAELVHAPGLGPGSKDKNLDVGSSPIIRTRKTKIEWPSDEEIIERLSNSNFSKLARELGVSDNAIRKRLKINK